MIGVGVGLGDLAARRALANAGVRLLLDFARGQYYRDGAFYAREQVPDLLFSRGSAAGRIGPGGLRETLGPNVLRITYDRVTGAARGYLPEEARTDIVPNSNAITAANGYSSNTAAWAVNGAVGPDGTMSATRLTASEYFFIDLAQPANGTFVLSAWARAAAGTSYNARLSILNRSSNALKASKIITVTDVWERFDVIGTTDGAATGLRAQMWETAGGVPPQVGTAIWGFDVQPGAFPTSTIVTNGGALTRASDDLYAGLVAVNHPLTLVADAYLDGIDGVDRHLVVLSEILAPTSNRLGIRRLNNNQLIAQVVSTAGVSTQANLGTFTGNGRIKVAVRLAQGQLSASVNGGAPVVVEGVTSPVGMERLTIGRFPFGLGHWSAPIASVLLTRDVTAPLHQLSQI